MINKTHLNIKSINTHRKLDGDGEGLRLIYRINLRISTTLFPIRNFYFKQCYLEIFELFRQTIISVQCLKQSHCYSTNWRSVNQWSDPPFSAHNNSISVWFGKVGVLVGCVRHSQDGSFTFKTCLLLD